MIPSQNITPPPPLLAFEAPGSYTMIDQPPSSEGIMPIERGSTFDSEKNIIKVALHMAWPNLSE